MVFRGTWGAGEHESNTRPVPAREELRKVDRQSCVAVGTLACSVCDAPIAIADARLSPIDQISCPYCLHQGPVRDALSLEPPTRPTRVVVRIALAASRTALPAWRR